jgi:FAD/FMN-containing dehydrogenase
MPYSQAIRQPLLFDGLDSLDGWWNILANTFGIHLSGTLVENPNNLLFLKNTIESAEGIIHTHGDLETNYYRILDTASNAGADDVTKRWMRELKHRFDPKGVLPALRG